MHISLDFEGSCTNVFVLSLSLSLVEYKISFRIKIKCDLNEKYLHVLLFSMVYQLKYRNINNRVLY